MSSTYGSKIKISVFGESHGEAIGTVIDGLPGGIKLDTDEIKKEMKRRAPGQNDDISTPRKEKDEFEIMSGVLDNTTTGAPLCMMIKNTNTISKDYDKLKFVPRPGHSDYPAFIKHNGFNDIRGGGHFSGRLTAPIVFAGAVFKQILKREGIEIFSHISSIANIQDCDFDHAAPDIIRLKKLKDSLFPLIDESLELSMKEEIKKARDEKDSVGGTIECIITGIPCGIGDPMFDTIEGEIAKAVFAVPAVKGIEFGKGFELSKMRGSQSNDEYMIKNGRILTYTNNMGGILGGISNGMPVTFKAAIKPTPSISKKQKSVNMLDKTETDLEIHGRHDPCIVPRAVPVIEAAAAVALINLI